jgi:hypothetical protein
VHFDEDALTVCVKVVAQYSLEIVCSRDVDTPAIGLEVHVLITRSSGKN